nr:RecQ family zinc-binding domain-containing protein [Lentilactobacillus otakiensis]
MNLIDNTIPEAGLLRYLYRHPKAITDDDQFRVIQYYFDNDYSLDQAAAIFDRSRQRRITELGSMVQYIYHDGCRRDELLKYFDEKLSTEDRNQNFCCDNDVDFWNHWQDFNDKYLDQQDDASKSVSRSWHEVIDQLFLSKN